MRPAFRLPDGSTYVGEWNGQIIHGKGVMEGENGKYEGYWENGVRLRFINYLRDKEEDVLHIRKATSMKVIGRMTKRTAWERTIIQMA